MDVSTRSAGRTRSDRMVDPLVVENMDFVRHILGRVLVELPTGVDEENLLSAGTLGLLEAARGFDPDRGVAFRTFAYRRIRGAIIDELRRNCPLPQRVLENLSLVRSARMQLMPPAAAEDIANYTGLSVAEVQECVEASRLTAPHTWGSEEESSHNRHRSVRPELSLELAETRDQLTRALERLPERERMTLTLYYLEGLRLKEIGEVLELSESRVSRILSKSEECLRDSMRTIGITGPSDLPPELA